MASLVRRHLARRRGGEGSQICFGDDGERGNEQNIVSLKTIYLSNEWRGSDNGVGCSVMWPRNIGGLIAK